MAPTSSHVLHCCSLLGRCCSPGLGPDCKSFYPNREYICHDSTDQDPRVATVPTFHSRSSLVSLTATQPALTTNAIYGSSASSMLLRILLLLSLDAGCLTPSTTILVAEARSSSPPYSVCYLSLDLRALKHGLSSSSVVFFSVSEWAQKHPLCQSMPPKMFPHPSEVDLSCPGKCGPRLAFSSAFVPILLCTTLAGLRGAYSLDLLSFPLFLWSLASTSAQNHHV